eukprot:403340778
MFQELSLQDNSQMPANPFGYPLSQTNGVQKISHHLNMYLMDNKENIAPQSFDYMDTSNEFGSKKNCSENGQAMQHQNFAPSNNFNKLRITSHKNSSENNQIYNVSRTQNKREPFAPMLVKKLR